ncbi:polysaccharide deacetylase family protein [Campylobacter upsaliensis]
MDIKCKEKIGIIGYGYVGRAFYDFFKSHFEVYAYDCDESLRAKFDFLETSMDFVDLMHLVVICVPTNALESGEVDMSAIHKALSEIKQEKLILIKSSIPPLSIQQLSVTYPHLKLVFSPEFIGESSYFLPPPYDFDKKVIKTPYFIFGGKDDDCSAVIKFFKEVAGPVKEYIKTTSLNAEVCKYMENAFFATKITFCNEFAAICKAFGADYDEVRELWLKDPRITKTHTLIFNEESEQCFGGKCLPKDLSGIIMQSFNQGYEAKFLQAVKKANGSLRNNAKKPHILCFHRIDFYQNNPINPLYFDRKMAVSYFKLEQYIESYLQRGFCFGNIKQCLQEPNKYFCLSFDDGFKEHLEIAKILHNKYNSPKESLIFSINVNNTLSNTFCGMDLLYHLIDRKQIKNLFEYFKLDLTPITLDNIDILKQHYIKQNPEELCKFYETFKVDLSYIFLDPKEIQELTNYGLIASHAILHRDLTQHKTQSKQEILESKMILEQMLKTNIDIFCYPEGKNDKDLWDFCKQAGFTLALSINHTHKQYGIGRRIAKL